MRERPDGAGHSLLPGFPSGSIPAGMGMGSREVESWGMLLWKSSCSLPDPMELLHPWDPLLSRPGARGMSPKLLQERRGLELELLPEEGVGINTWILQSCAGQGHQDHSLAGNLVPEGAAALLGSARLRADMAPRPWSGIPAGAAVPGPEQPPSSAAKVLPGTPLSTGAWQGDKSASDGECLALGWHKVSWRGAGTGGSSLGSWHGAGVWIHGSCSPEQGAGGTQIPGKDWRSQLQMDNPVPPLSLPGTGGAGRGRVPAVG